MVTPAVYSSRTLCDNWLEDRLQPHGALSATGSLTAREPRKVETDLAYIGERYDVLSRIARMPQRISYATPQDGFDEKQTIHRQDFGELAAHPLLAKKPPPSVPLITTANAPVCPPEQRPLDGPDSGFGSALPRHPKTHGMRFFNTTHGDFFGYGDGLHKEKLCPSFLSASGFNSADAEKRVSGMKCGQLCGESFRVVDDPALDTRTQRAWMPGTDPGIANAHLGGMRHPPPGDDNELSLPLGDGAMSKVRADLTARRGRLCRIATNITQGGKQRGVRVFQDDDA